jgi:tetratricopeptide (TPR) repeat protein
LRKLVAGGGDDAALQALVTLLGEPPPAGAGAASLAEQLAHHPGAEVHHQLLATQTLHALAPDAAAKAALVEDAITKFRDAHLAVLLGWLNANGLHRRTLELVDFDEARSGRQLFGPWSRAMIAAQRTGELIEKIEHDRTRVPISSEACELVFVDAYEAEGKPVIADTHWNIALRAANTGNRKASLLQLAQWAERRGYSARALAAYQRLLAASPEFTPHCYDRIAVLARQTDQLALLRTISRELLERVPENAVYRQNYAYLSVLAGDDLDRARKLLDGLLESYPKLYGARCTLALLERTSGDLQSCARLLDQVPIDELDPTDRYLYDLLSGTPAAEPDGLSGFERDALGRLLPISAAMPAHP